MKCDEKTPLKEDPVSRARRKQLRSKSRRALPQTNGSTQDQKFEDQSGRQRLFSKDFKDAVKNQETCAKLLVVLLFVIYFVSGIVYYRGLHGWTFTDSVYFTVNTFLSVGYGDMAIDTTREQLFTAFFVLFGVGFIGSSIGMVMSGEADSKSQALHEYYKSDQFEKDGGEDKFCIHAWEMGYYRKKLLINVLQLILIVIVGTTVMGIAEDWGLVEGFYWSIVTITTTGYGDLTPTTNATKWFCTFYSFYGVIQVARALSFIAQFPVLINRLWEEKKILHDYKHSRSYKELLRQMGESEEFEVHGLHKTPGIIDRAEFILSMLMLLEQVPIEEVKECNRAFDVLDADQSGTITVDDFKPSAIAKKGRRQSVNYANEV